VAIVIFDTKYLRVFMIHVHAYQISHDAHRRRFVTYNFQMET